MRVFILLALVVFTSAQSSQWKSFVDSTLIGSKTVSKAAICGSDGSVLAKSDNFALTTEEAVAASRAFSNPMESRRTGLTFEGVRYIVLLQNDDTITGKLGSKGFVISKTKQNLIISMYDSDMQPGECRKTTETLADYLKSAGI